MVFARFNQPKFFPFERPALGVAPSYARRTTGDPATLKRIRENVRKVDGLPIAAITFVGAAVMGGRTFLLNNGVDLDRYLDIELIDRAARSGVCLAQAESRTPASNPHGIELHHAVLYAQMRAELSAADRSGAAGWAAYVFDVSYFTDRTDGDWVEFYGPVARADKDVESPMPRVASRPPNDPARSVRTPPPVIAESHTVVDIEKLIYHSDWHRIWVAAMAGRAKYRSRSLAQRFTVGGIVGLSDSLRGEAKRYTILNWSKAVKNGETCSECGNRPTIFAGKPLF